MSEFRLMIDWQLTAAECRALLCLAQSKTGFSTHHEIHRAISRGRFTVPTVVKVMVHRLRKKIAGRGIEIATHHCIGYSLKPEAVEIVKRAMGDHAHAQVSETSVNAA